MALLAVKWFNVSVTGMSSKVVPEIKHKVIRKQSKLVILAQDAGLPLSFYSSFLNSLIMLEVIKQ